MSAIISGLIHAIITDSIVGPLQGWLIAGIMGYMGYLAIFNSLKIERLKLAAHMLRSLSLHATIASERENNEALSLVEEAERKWRGFISRAFRAAGTVI